MHVCLQQRLGRAGQIGVNQEAHSGALAGQRMVSLLFDEFLGVINRGADVVHG